MLQEENRLYEPYPPLPQRPLSAPVGILDDHPVTRVPPEQDASQPPRYPSGPPTAPAPPHKRPGRAGAIIALTLVLAIIFGIGLFAGWEFAGNSSGTSTTSNAGVTPAASPSSGNNLETQQEAAIARIEPAVVELKVTTAQGQQIGSGVIIDTRGDIVTNNHVISGAQTIDAVLSNGSTEKAQLVGMDAADDLAVVRIQPFAHMTVAQIGNSSKLVVGQEVLAIGNPLGITETVTRGIVSALNRSVTESTGTTISHAIQTDAAINPGNSGGALVNLQGQLIGIPTLTAINTESNTPANGVGFAIPSNRVETVVQQLIQG
ncbi:MAG: trypsin-like peptidase domain-containing protein [Ktedonobacteraceae bacterium]